MPEISIDVERRTLSISYGEARVIQRGKNLEFWCLLLSVDGWVSVHDVHALPGWAGMTRESVGKQVARLIDQMRAQQLDLIEWRLKTDGWRLRQAVWDKLDPETVEAARSLLEERRQKLAGRFASVEPHAMAGWALNAVSAAIAMTSGHAEEGYAALKASYAETDNLDMHAIADVLATRIGQRFEKPHAPVIGPIGAEASVFEMAVEARRLAAYAIRTDSSAWQT